MPTCTACNSALKTIHFALTIVLSVCLNVFTPVSSEDKIVVSTYHGQFGRMLEEQVFQEYKNKTGVSIAISSTDRWTLETLRSYTGSDQYVPDIVTLNDVDALIACEDGLIEPIDVSALVSMQDGNLTSSDFYDGVVGECAVAVASYAMPLLYDSSIYTSDPPDNVTDFFNLSEYPGKRGLSTDPKYTLPWALLAADISRDEIGKALSNENDLDRAYAMLDKIRGEIVWWDTDRQAAELFANGKVTMTPIWNYNIADLRESVPGLDMVWKQRVGEFVYFAIPASTQRKDDALNLLGFITDPEVQIRLGLQGWGPIRSSAAAGVVAQYQCAVGECPCEGVGGCSKQCCQSGSPLPQVPSVWRAEGGDIRDRFSHWLMRD